MSTLLELRKDVARNQAEIEKLRLEGAPPAKIAEHLSTTLWPFLEALLEPVAELDEAVDALIEESDDLLQADTASKISVPLVLAADLIKELEKRLLPQGSADDGIRVKVNQFKVMFAEATNLIAEITIFDEDPEAPEGDDDEDEEEDDDGEEE